ncbi:MAG: polysaccharide deacetylase family protein [Alphaproteobacteria bacterium]
MEYDFVPLPDRRNLCWPNGARLAVILTINLEYWELTRDQTEPLYPGGPATIPFPLPGNVPDYVNWTWREYGHRVGVWRIIDALDAAGIPASCTMNARMATDRRRIIDAVNERGWELVPHNWAQNDILTSYAHEPDAERDVIRRTLDVYEQVVGRPARGWLSSSLRPTARTADFLAEFGCRFFCDLLNDDQPYLLRTATTPLVCVPYSTDVNAFNMFARGGMTLDQGLVTLREQFDQLYAEGADSMRIMNFGMHPHVMGQPYRIRALRDFLTYLKGFDDIWFPKREEIADWYLENHQRHIG